MNYAAKGPHVALTSVELSIENLGRDITKCAKRFLSSLIRTYHFRKAKIHEFRHSRPRFVCHHDVLELHVTMHDAIAVQVLEALQDLVRYLTDTILAQLEVVVLKVGIEVTTFHVIENDVVLESIFKQIDELYDIGVLTHLEYLNLFHLLENLEVRHLLLQNRLDGVLLACLDVDGEFDQAVGALT